MAIRFVVALCFYQIISLSHCFSDENGRIICTCDVTGRFVGLERSGNGDDRNGMFHTFEYIAESSSLRLLHETRLINKTEPRIRVLSPDGRFLVTMDEHRTYGTGPATLVVYDLVRREHTSYFGKDFLSDKLRESLSPIGDREGDFSWYGADFVFNASSTKFYPTKPESCDRYKVPFIVVDLPSRTVRVEPHKDVVVADLTPVSPRGFGWTISPTFQNVKIGSTVLPKSVIKVYADESKELFEVSPKGDFYNAAK